MKELVRPVGRVKRSEAEHLQDLDKIAHMYLRGYSMSQIAEAISKERRYTISKRQVFRDIQKIRKMWIENATTAFNEALGRELAKIDELEKAYWDGYEKATGNKTTVLKEVINEGGVIKDRELKKVVQEGGLGAEFLKGIQWCIEKRVELLGMKTGTNSLTISWKEEAKRDGIDSPEELFEKVVNFLTETLKNNKDKMDVIEGEILDGKLLNDQNMDN